MTLKRTSETECVSGEDKSAIEMLLLLVVIGCRGGWVWVTVGLSSF